MSKDLKNEELKETLNITAHFLKNSTLTEQNEYWNCLKSTVKDTSEEKETCENCANLRQFYGWVWEKDCQRLKNWVIDYQCSKCEKYHLVQYTYTLTEKLLTNKQNN